VRILAGLFLHVVRRGPERLGYLLERAASAVRFDPAHPTAIHDRDDIPSPAAGRSGSVIAC
jgi:hypothetical protein